MSIWRAVMPSARAGDLEVHVAVVVFLAGDVGQDREPVALPDEAHRDARDRRLDRHAGVHEGERAAADRRHRRGAVRLEDVGDDADGVGEGLLARQDGRERAAGQDAVADLAARRAAHELHLADREGREVVVEQELVLALALVLLDDLGVVGGAERGGDERLRLAAGEERGAVRAREETRPRRDRADLVERAAVEALALVEDRLARQDLDEVVDGLARSAGAARARSPGSSTTAAFLTALISAYELDLARAGQGRPHRRLPLRGGPRRRPRRSRPRARARPASGSRRARWRSFWARDDPADRLVAEEDRVEHRLLGDLVGARLDHHDRLLGAGDDEVDLGLLALGVGRVEDELPVDRADADRADRGVERDERARSATEAPLIARMSGSFSPSAERTKAMIWVSWLKPSGKSGRSGRSISREVRISFSVGRPSRLKKPPGIRPAAYVFSR